MQDQDEDIEALRHRVDALARAVRTLTIETSVLQELCSALMAELAVQDGEPAQRLERIIADEQQISYMVAVDMDEHEDHDDAMWDMLVHHAEVRNRAFDHARMALARIMGAH